MAPLVARRMCASTLTLMQGFNAYIAFPAYDCDSWQKHNQRRGLQSSICKPLRPASAEAGFPLGEPTVLCSRRMKVP